MYASRRLKKNYRNLATDKYFNIVKNQVHIITENTRTKNAKVRFIFDKILQHQRFKIHQKVHELLEGEMKQIQVCGNEIEVYHFNLL